MRRRLMSTAVLAAVVAACGSPASPSPTPAPSPTAAPTVASSAAGSPTSGDAFAGAPYTLVVPAGWRAFNLADPAAKAGLDAYVAANPSLAAAISSFEAIPGVRMAVNPLLGNVLLVITTPSNGTPLDTLATSFTAQFQLVPGLQSTPSPQNLTLPGGNAVHWTLQVQSNKPGGGTITAQESIYLLANATDAVILEFVTPSGGVVPDEQAIVTSFSFNK